MKKTTTRFGLRGTEDLGSSYGAGFWFESGSNARERAGNKVMMVCVSGCKSDSLTLDL